MTELTCVSHRNYDNHVKLGSVGKPLEGIEQKIAEDGEILIKGDIVFKGYYKNEEESKSAINEGWLSTGDIGKIDEDGYLFITDRKKHIIITSGGKYLHYNEGKNITPSNIQNKIKNLDNLISNVHPHGDKRNFITCIITPRYINIL
jgi:long-chain acyl-CoA synthetase